MSDGLYDTSGWEIDQSGYVGEDFKKKKKKNKKEKKVNMDAITEESDAAQIRTVSSEELRMSDSAYQVDPRTASILGQGPQPGSVVYDNPMMKKKKVNLGKAEGSATESSGPEIGGDDSSWLFK